MRKWFDAYAGSRYFESKLMKKITVNFYSNGSPLALVTGFFPVLPGRGKLVWKDKQALEDKLKAPYKAPLPMTHYAESFETAFVVLAERCGVTATVETSGEWESFEE